MAKSIGPLAALATLVLTIPLVAADYFGQNSTYVQIGYVAHSLTYMVFMYGMLLLGLKYRHPLISVSAYVNIVMRATGWALVGLLALSYIDVASALAADWWTHQFGRTVSEVMLGLSMFPLRQELGLFGTMTAISAILSGISVALDISDFGAIPLLTFGGLVLLQANSDELRSVTSSC